MLMPNFAPISAPNTPSSWTGVSSYDGFWSKFNNSQYLTQIAANELAKLQVQDSANGLAPAGSQLPFTNTAAPGEIVGPTQRYD
jgi:hypothetical protein